MLTTHVSKEWREQRWTALILSVVIAFVGISLAYAFPKEAVARLPWFAIAAFAGALVFGSDLFGGESRRRQVDYLARLPGALRTSFWVKTSMLFALVAGLGLVGLAVDVVIPIVTDATDVGGFPGSLAVVGWALALGTCLFGASCWWPTGLIALATTVIGPLVLLAPLGIACYGLAGLWPVPLELESLGGYAAVAGLILAWVGVRMSVARPRERAPWTRYALTVGLLFVPVWGIGVSNILSWHHADPEDPSARFSRTFVAPDFRHAYVTLQRDALRGAHVWHALRVDLETGSWEQVGETQSGWDALHQVDVGMWYGSYGVPAAGILRWTATADGAVVLDREVVSAIDGEVRASGTRQELVESGVLTDLVLSGPSPFRTPDGSSIHVLGERMWKVTDGVPEELPWRAGDFARCGYGWGFRIGRRDESGPTERYFDQSRLRVVEFPRTNGGKVARIRKGAWITNVFTDHGARMAGTQELYDPDTGATAPLVGLEDDDSKGPLLADDRIVLYRSRGEGLWFWNPETGERTAVSLPDGIDVQWIGNPLWPGDIVTTPGGLSILRLGSSSRESCFARVDGDRLVCTPTLSVHQRFLVCPDEDTILVEVEDHRIERLRFGSEMREILFPR